ncbi:MAG: long-chain fatty acid--CoA ligase [archaeon]
MKTLQDIVESLETRGSKSALQWKENGKLKNQSFKELYNQIQNYSKAFLELGLEKGDKVALFAENVPEWISLNLGIVNAGLVDAPRGKEAPIEELDYILDHSEAKVLIVEDKIVLDKIDIEKHKNTQLYSIRHINGVNHISELEQLGKESTQKIPKVGKDDLAGFIYTSGTTGVPKGAMLTHGNFTSNVDAVLNRLTLMYNDRVLSMLPPWHSFERIIKYVACASGTTTFISSKEHVKEDLPEQKPTIMASVPKIWEQVYDGLMTKISEEKGLKRTIAKYAIKQSVDYATNKRLLPSPWKKLWHEIAHKVVYSKLHEKLGGNFRFAASGGGALPPHIDDFFHAAGIRILEGYGLTETSPIIAMRTLGQNELHTIGTLIDKVEAKIVDIDTGKDLPKYKEGVLHVRGPNIMRGYYKDTEETKAVLRNGWLDTGDICYFDSKNRLHITGRAKEIIVLSNGENIAPVPIENALKQSPYIEDSIVLGQDWNGLGALVVPDSKAISNYCKENGLECSLDNMGIRQLYEDEINKQVNTKNGFQRFHKIRDFELLPQSFIIGEELTATLKPMRRKIDKKYSSQIDSVYKRIHKKK